MKKLTLIAAICLMFAATIKAQSITPIQLKQARMAAYQWIRDYNVYAKMEGKREPTRKFIALFEDETTLLFNDYLPLLNTKGNKISARDYASILAKKEAIYKMSFEIRNATIISEELDDSGNIVFVLGFDKIVSFQENGNTSDDLYAYPKKTYHAIVRIKYNIKEESALADGIHSDFNFGEILVLHDTESEFVNQYTSRAKLESECLDNSSTLIKWNYATADFDEQMVYYYQDTIKNSLHFGGSIGYSTYSARMINDNFTGFTPQGGLYYAFSIGYYRLLMLKDKNRLGIDISASFTQKSIGSMANGYKEMYNAVDPDGGNYLRIIELNSYNERVNRYAIDVPIALRYDYLINNRISAYAKLGAEVSYDLIQQAKATANAQYSGYYDWLFDVTISQNGVYDFGAFNIEGTSNTIGINKLGIGIFAGIGIQYFIPKSRWSFDAALLYGCEVFNRTTNPIGIHLTEDKDNWNSATLMLKPFNGHNIQLQINFNYNF